MHSINNTDQNLDKDIATYNAMKEELEKTHLGKWVLFYDCQLKGIYEDFDSAAKDAIKQFGRGPYLIRQIGVSPIILPASIVYTHTGPYNAS